MGAFAQDWAPTSFDTRPGLGASDASLTRGTRRSGSASPFASPEPSEWMSTLPVYSFALMSASLWKVTPPCMVPKLLIVASYCRA